MSFHVGQRVVCVRVGRAKDEPGHHNRNWPASVQSGTVLTIREVEVSLAATHNCPIALRFEEYVHPRQRGGWETPFPGECFRPLDEKRLDIFRAMLVTPPKQRVQA